MRVHCCSNHPLSSPPFRFLLSQTGLHPPGLVSVSRHAEVSTRTTTVTASPASGAGGGLTLLDTKTHGKTPVPLLDSAERDIAQAYGVPEGSPRSVMRHSSSSC